MKINTILPVCLSDGTPARIIASDRKNLNGYSLVILYGAHQEAVTTGSPDGTLVGEASRTLMNKFIYDGLAAGMKLNPFTGYDAPNDFDPSRKIVWLSGEEHDLAYCYPSWEYFGMSGTVVLYWPLPETVTLELTKDEAETLAGILANVGGPIEGRRKHADSIARKISGGYPSTTDWFESNADCLYFKD